MESTTTQEKLNHHTDCVWRMIEARDKDTPTLIKSDTSSDWYCAGRGEFFSSSTRDGALLAWTKAKWPRKTVVFEGVECDVTEDVKWITRDPDGAVIAHVEPPQLFDTGWVSVEDFFLKQADHSWKHSKLDV